MKGIALKIRRIVAGLTLATALATGALLTNTPVATPADTTWGAPSPEDTTWGARPPSTGGGTTVTPLDTTWG